MTAPPSRDALVGTDLVPLVDLGAGNYRGLEGGLYGGGSNQPPPAYLARGLARAAEVAPRDSHGQPSPRGKIGLISVGMSHASHAFQAFAKSAGERADVAPSVLLVDCAKKTCDAVKLADADHPYWSYVLDTLRRAALTPLQVQAVWLKEAVAGERLLFPEDIAHLAECLELISGKLEAIFPSLKLIYISSRSFGGYAAHPTAVSPEPTAYHTGFAVRSVIQRRLGSVDPSRGPWLGWGPYFWANGLSARRDGLTWRRDAFAADGTHLSPIGAEQAGNLLLQFFFEEPTAFWFRTSSAPRSEAP